jgi:hypothetical protein
MPQQVLQVMLIPVVVAVVLVAVLMEVQAVPA